MCLVDQGDLHTGGQCFNNKARFYPGAYNDYIIFFHRECPFPVRNILAIGPEIYRAYIILCKGTTDKRQVNLLKVSGPKRENRISITETGCKKGEPEGPAPRLTTIGRLVLSQAMLFDLSSDLAVGMRVSMNIDVEFPGFDHLDNIFCRFPC
jgi:hypothetical protein